jgi:hypothetical protein
MFRLAQLSGRSPTEPNRQGISGVQDHDRNVSKANRYLLWSTSLMIETARIRNSSQSKARTYLECFID